MTTPAMFPTVTLVFGAALAEEAMIRASEVPEFASMALLAVVLAAVSVMVRRAGSKNPDRDRRRSGTTSRP